MAAMTLNQRQPDASAEKPVASEVLAGSNQVTGDPGARSRSEDRLGLRNHDGAIASGVEELRPGRFEGGMTMAQVIGGAR